MKAARLIALENYQEILDQLTPEQLLVVALRAEFGLNDRQIGQEIGLTKQAVSKRFRQAAQAIAGHLPHLAYEGRRQQFYARSELDSNERAFLRTLAFLTKQGQKPTTATIGQAAGLHRRTVIGICARLYDRDLVQVTGITTGKTPNTRTWALTREGWDKLDERQ